jgi:hypothetical protein
LGVLPAWCKKLQPFSLRDGHVSRYVNSTNYAHYFRDRQLFTIDLQILLNRVYVYATHLCRIYYLKRQLGRVTFLPLKALLECVDFDHQLDLLINDAGKCALLNVGQLFI